MPERRYMACATCGYPKPYGTSTVYACLHCGDVGTAIMTTAGAAKERQDTWDRIKVAQQQALGPQRTAAERAAEMDRLGFGEAP